MSGHHSPLPFETQTRLRIATGREWRTLGGFTMTRSLYATLKSKLSTLCRDRIRTLNWQSSDSPVLRRGTGKVCRHAQSLADWHKRNCLPDRSAAMASHARRVFRRWFSVLDIFMVSVQELDRGKAFVSQVALLQDTNPDFSLNV